VCRWSLFRFPVKLCDPDVSLDVLTGAELHNV
jgi:hypothetical protein